MHRLADAVLCILILKNVAVDMDAGGCNVVVHSVLLLPLYSALVPRPGYICAQYCIDAGCCIVLIVSM